MALRATCTLLEFLETFPNDQFFIRQVDEVGPYVCPVQEEMLRHPKTSSVWHQQIKVCWNDAGTVAITTKAVADPQRGPRSASPFICASGPGAWKIQVEKGAGARAIRAPGGINGREGTQTLPGKIHCASKWLLAMTGS